MLLLKLVGYLAKECLVSFDVIGHSLEDSIDPVNSELLLEKGALLITQLTVHTGLDFLDFIHYPVSDRATALLNNLYPVNIHLHFDVERHSLILFLDHPKSI